MAGFVALRGDVLDSGTMSIEALHSFVRGWLASFDIIDRFLAYSTRHPLGPVQHDELEVRATQRRYRETDKDQIRERRRRKWESDEALRDRQRASNRAWQRRKRYQQVYGISLADYDAMLHRQGSACAICRRFGDALCVDHYDACGKVRGLLCIKCNGALGFCNDSPTLLLAAAPYLRAACDHEGTMPMTAPSPGEACAPPGERVAGNGSFAGARHCRCAGKAV